MPDLINIKAVALQLGISLRSVKKRCLNEGILIIRIGRNLLISKQQFENMILRCAEQCAKIQFGRKWKQGLLQAGFDSPSEEAQSNHYTAQTSRSKQVLHELS